MTITHPILQWISCRPRQYVIDETLTHSETMEETFDKLEETGDFICYGKGNLDVESNFTPFNKHDPIISRLMSGNKRIFVDISL